MKKGIYISIKPKHLKKIIIGEKNYEFRNYYPKQKIDILYVYETVPTCSLKYIIELGEIIEYPNKIKKEGYGNSDFNNGLKAKYAYEIKHVDILKEPISLSQLRDIYRFTPPQAYAYDTKYLDLTKIICNAKTKRIF